MLATKDEPPEKAEPRARCRRFTLGYSLLDCASVFKHSPDDSSQCRKLRTPVGGKKNVSVSYSRRDLR